ncbi:MAG: iron-sulfur cluster assembly scaffold protein [Pseudomonadota bacterium]
MQLSDLYQTRLLELNRAPLNFGVLASYTHTARGEDALCGDDVLVQLVVDAEARIEQAAWSGHACAVTSASASLLTDWLVGKPVARVADGMADFKRLLDGHDGTGLDLGELTLLAAVRHFPSRVNNALLPWRTVLEALRQYPRHVKN